MKMYASSTNSFYDTDVHPSDKIPKDAVQLTDAEYQAAFDGQASGKRIQPGKNGFPALAAIAPTVDSPAATALAALQASDKVVLRCFESAVSLPRAWAAYRAGLRLVVAGKLTTLPTRPEYPT